MIANARPGTRVEEHRCHDDTIAGAIAEIPGDHFVENGLALVGAEVGPGAVEDQAEAGVVAITDDIGPALIWRKRIAQGPTPAGIIAGPIDSFKRHANNLRSPTISAAGKKLLEGGAAAVLGLFEMGIEFAGEHFSGDLGLAGIACFGGVEVAAAALEQRDHCLIVLALIVSGGTLIAVSCIHRRTIIAVLP